MNQTQIDALKQALATDSPIQLGKIAPYQAATARGVSAPGHVEVRFTSTSTNQA